MSEEFVSEEFVTPEPEVKKKKITVEPTWYCVHCQRPTPKRLTVVHDGARVCQDQACVKFVILEDGYASAEVKAEVAAKRPCGRCGKE